MVRFPLNSYADHLRAQATRANPVRSHEGSQTLLDGSDGRPRSALPTVACWGQAAVLAPKEQGTQVARDAYAQAAGGQMQAAWGRAAGPDGRINPW